MALSERLLSKLTDQDLVDHLVYSGAEQYDWCVRLEDTPNSIFISMEDPNNSDGVVSVELTFEQIRKGICEMLDSEESYEELLESVVQDDFDSYMADVVLQYLCLGEVVYA